MVNMTACTSVLLKVARNFRGSLTRLAYSGIKEKFTTSMATPRPH
jgi:hypothetical protein